MYDVFISYSRKEKDKATAVLEKLQQNGFSCWMDLKGLYGGDDYEQEIDKAISSSKVFVLILNNACLDSKYIPIEAAFAREAYAQETLKKIIPFQTDKDFELAPGHPLRTLTIRFQRIEAFGEKFDSALDELVFAIKTTFEDERLHPSGASSIKVSNEEDEEARKKKDEDAKLLKKIKAGERVALKYSTGVSGFCDASLDNKIIEICKHYLDGCTGNESGSSDSSDNCILEVYCSGNFGLPKMPRSRTLRIVPESDFLLFDNVTGYELNKVDSTLPSMMDVVQKAESATDDIDLLYYDSEKKLFPNMDNLKWPVTLKSVAINIDGGGFSQLKDACRSFLGFGNFLRTTIRDETTHPSRCSAFEKYQKIKNAGVTFGKLTKFDGVMIEGISLIKNPIDLLRTIKDFMIEDGKIIIADYDLGIAQLIPDRSGLFAESKSIYASMNAFGYADSGREVPKYLRISGYCDIALAHAGSIYFKMAYDFKESLFFDFYDAMESKFRVLARKFPEEGQFKSKLAWFKDHFEDIRSEFLEEDTIFLPGYMIWTATVGESDNSSEFSW